MDDTVYRQAAIDEFWQLDIEIRPSAIDAIIKMLMNLPSAQPEIIRCKDCKHKPSDSGANHDISFPDGVCPCQCEDNWYSWIPKDDWYCADAERR